MGQLMRRTGTLLLSLGLAGLMVGGAATHAHAADGVEIATPTATGTLGASITYTDTFQASTTPTAVELLLQEPGLYGSVVTDADVVPVAGGYRAEVQDSSHVIPNTTIGYRFRVISADGSTLGPSATFTLQDTRYTWQTISGTHVRLHWYSGDTAFAQKALAVGDAAVTRVSALLGVQETQPIDFFVYASADGLDGALGPGTSEFVAGRAIPEIRTLFAEIDPDQIDFELGRPGHPARTDAPGLRHGHPQPVPRAAAVAQRRAGRVRIDRLRPGRPGTHAGCGGQWVAAAAHGPDRFLPRSPGALLLSYAEAVSAVDFFVRTYGQAHLVQLIRSYAQGVTDDQAFQAAAGVDVAGFQAAWLDDLKTSLPTAVGPRQPAAGVLPPGWRASSGTAASSLPTTAPAPVPGSDVGTSSGGGALSSALDDVAQTLRPVLGLGVLLLILATVLLYLRRRAIARRLRGSPGGPPPGGPLP